MNILTDALRIAASQIGVLEYPLGSNRGIQVDAYQRAIGLDPKDKNPWCMAFIYWCFQQAAMSANVVNPAIKLAQCIGVWHRASNLSAPKQITATQAQADYSLVQPGMIFILETNPNTHAGHTGFVESVDYKTGRITTIEGNTNELTMSREGVGVFRLTRRTIKSINIGFIHYTIPVEVVQPIAIDKPVSTTKPVVSA